MVHAIDEHGGLVLGGSAHEHELGARVQMSLDALFGEELAGALNDVVNAQLAPAQIFGIAAVEQQDGLAVDDQVILIVLDGSFPLAVNGVVHEVISQHLGSLVRCVDGNDVHVSPAGSFTCGKTSDAAESVDSDLDHY